MNRKEQRLFRFAVDLFVDLLQQTTNRPRVNYKCNNQDTLSWQYFMQEYGNSVGENFIREFAEYGMHSWFNESAGKDYSKVVRFGWIFGKKAIQRWNALPGHARTNYVRKQYKQNYKINTKKTDSKITELVNTVRISEENIKKRFYGTNRGFLWCVANTSLYFHKSTLCVSCKYKKDCKETLRMNYPKTYIVRGYGE